MYLRFSSWNYEYAASNSPASSSCLITSHLLVSPLMCSLAQAVTGGVRRTSMHWLYFVSVIMSVTMKPHSDYSPLCVLKASIWVRRSNKVINLYLFCLCVCSRIVDECERDRKRKGEVWVYFLVEEFLTHICRCAFMHVSNEHDPQQWRVVEFWIFNFYLMFTQFPHKRHTV